jgi:hypothetical protein
MVGGGVVAAYTEQFVPPPLLARGHEIEASAAAETPVPAAAEAGGDVAEVSTADAMSTSILEIIDLDASDLPSNDRDIYEAVLEQILADPVELGVEALESAAPVDMASAEAAEPANEELAPGATTVGQLTSGQAEVAKDLEPSATSEAAKEVLGEPAASAELPLTASSPPTAGVDSTTANAPELSSLQPTTPVEEAAPMASPFLLAP